MIRFENGNTGLSGTISITSEFLDTDARASARALAEFVEGSFSVRSCSFQTYLTDIKVGDIVSVRGLSYKVTSVGIAVDAIKMVSSITGERYES